MDLIVGLIETLLFIECGLFNDRYCTGPLLLAVLVLLALLAGLVAVLVTAVRRVFGRQTPQEGAGAEQTRPGSEEKTRQENAYRSSSRDFSGRDR